MKGLIRMNRMDFRNYLDRNIMILDGATGTELQRRGMPGGVCPETWVIENPKVILDVQRSYIEAGSNAIYTCTFGGNPIKLGEFGFEQRTVEINRKLAGLSREAAGGKAFVVGDLAPTGQFIRPFGEIPFEDIVNAFKLQVKGLLEGGVDFFVIETMMDIHEARAALLAVKESCDLPVCVSMTFAEDGRTLTGTDPVTALVTLQSLGADAVGCNCSTGPQDMIKIIKALKPYARIPVIAKPNAGVPKLVNGKTVFDMSPVDFGSYAGAFAEAGVNLMGGCCGTSPEYIRELSQRIKGMCPVVHRSNAYGMITSTRKTVFIGKDRPVVVVGERINPTGKKKLQEELREGVTLEVRRFAAEQIEKGAEILDVNVGMPGIDEKSTMLKVVELLSSGFEAPLCIDSSSPEVIEAALREYPGRALINSISAEKAKLEKLLPVAAKYGAMFILLPLNDAGVPVTAAERCSIVEQVYEKASGYGFTKSDIAVDGLVMTVSADQNAAGETLKVIDWCTNSFGCATILGLSNVSFGLPERSWINTAFLAMAIGRGLGMAIANPSSDMLVNIKMACDVLTCRDKNSTGYISRFTHMKGTAQALSEIKQEATPVEKLFNAVLKGDRESIPVILGEVMAAGNLPSAIVDNCLIPAITEVGRLFDRKEYYLPQLIQSAEAMKAAFEVLEPMLRKDEYKADKGIKVLLATVKGDIHDIGKNIVGLMLKNYGFDVIDLGKDVDEREIVAKAKEVGAEIVGLSALMTTTMVEMKRVISHAKEAGLTAKFMIGGAVVDENYAREIGADGYSQDAYSAVKLAKRLSCIE